MSVLSPQFGNLVPTPKLETLASNYLNFADGGGNDFRMIVTGKLILNSFNC